MPNVACNNCSMYFTVLGLWLHLNIEYTGALQMTLETKINLSKLGKEKAPSAVEQIQTSHLRLVCVDNLKGAVCNTIVSLIIFLIETIIWLYNGSLGSLF